MSAKLLKPIIMAEGASTLVSVGAVLAMTQCQSAINPVRNFVAKRFIYPILADKSASDTTDQNDPLFVRACEKATLLVKGGLMVGAGFASHVPIQMALEGHCDAKSFHHVIVGKSAGIGVALGSVFLLGRLMPSLSHSVHKVTCPALHHVLPQNDENKPSSHELCKLMTLEIPSSIISGLVNYGIARRHSH